MYWNNLKANTDSSFPWININMRCIEILEDSDNGKIQDRLTLTWDVLKFRCRCNRKGCRLININMRCIEIFIFLSHKGAQAWLTLTWDVLKLTIRKRQKSRRKININMRCIEIWTVVKKCLINVQININMRCIEISI